MNNQILYPPITPFNKGYLKVSEIHSLYFEQSGNKDGIPILFLHGGPGGGCLTRDRRYFDPKYYHIILFDQRGCGKSNPLFCLEENETKYLLEDIEKIRNHLKINKWAVFGGSWGSTLALIYSETYIEKVLGLILHGISLSNNEERKWFYQKGASYLFPEAYQEFVEIIPQDERDNILKAYYTKLLSSDETERLKYAMAWAKWEMSTFNFKYNKESIKNASNSNYALAIARIEAHYFINNCFIENEQIIKNAYILTQSNIPIFIIHGRYDSVCPLSSAWKLFKQIPTAEFYIIEEAGHAPKEVAIQSKLVYVCNKLKERII